MRLSILVPVAVVRGDVSYQGKLIHLWLRTHLTRDVIFLDALSRASSLPKPFLHIILGLRSSKLFTEEVFEINLRRSDDVLIYTVTSHLIVQADFMSWCFPGHT